MFAHLPTTFHPPRLIYSSNVRSGGTLPSPKAWYDRVGTTSPIHPLKVCGVEREGLGKGQERGGCKIMTLAPGMPTIALMVSASSSPHLPSIPAHTGPSNGDPEGTCRMCPEPSSFHRCVYVSYRAELRCTSHSPCPGLGPWASSQALTQEKRQQEGLCIYTTPVSVPTYGSCFLHHRLYIT